MRSRLTEGTELEQLEVRLVEVEELATEIDKLKIELHSKINKLKGKREKFSESTNEHNIKQERGYKRGTRELANLNIEKDILTNYGRKITTIRNKSKNFNHKSDRESETRSYITDNSKLYLTEKTSGNLKKGDKVRIINHYRGKFGDLYGKIGTIHEVGKAFIFIKIPNIPVLQQRIEGNLQLVEEG